MTPSEETTAQLLQRRRFPVLAEALDLRGLPVLVAVPVAEN